MLVVQVAIDVRAEQAGVVSKIHVQPGDERAVGTVLLEIDTDPAAVGTASKADAKQESTRTSAPAAAPAPAPPTHAVQATPSSAAHARKPSIQFRYGKRETASVVAANKGGAPSAQSPASFFGNYNEYLDKVMPSKAKKSYLELPPLFGRPPISPAEMAAIQSGGAY
jgi:pyruvate/2-oxoglutarate dehydrogenase complex dihydrolipoamide acyltransferase (E2) component